MKKIVKIGILLSLVLILLWKSEILGNILKPNTVQAVGVLTIDLGVPNGDPIFTFTNAAPGDSESHTVAVNNSDTEDQLIGVKGLKTKSTGNLESQMDIVISQNGTDIYGGQSSTGPKTLADFFSDSKTVNGISLTTIPKNTTGSYHITVTFAPQAGNKFKGTYIQFNLQFGVVTSVPQACESTHFDHVITGTAGNEVLNGDAVRDSANGGNGKDTCTADETKVSCEL